MKPYLLVLVAAALVPCGTAAFAQNVPGTPNGILQQDFQLQAHPQLEFAASAPDPKYQHGTTARRRKADSGDPTGDACNLQCSPD